MKASFKKCVSNIKINMKEVIYMYAGSIHVDEDTGQWWTLLNKAIKYCFQHRLMQSCLRGQEFLD